MVDSYDTQGIKDNRPFRLCIVSDIIDQILETPKFKPTVLMASADEVHIPHGRICKTINP